MLSEIKLLNQFDCSCSVCPSNNKRMYNCRYLLIICVTYANKYICIQVNNFQYDSDPAALHFFLFREWKHVH